MDLDHAQTHTTASQGRPRHADVRLHGGWLVLVRVGWVVVLVLALVLFIASLPFTFEDARTICASSACSNNGHLTLDEARGLRHLGLSLDFYAIFTIALSVLLECVYVATGIVIFWRRSDDRMALLSSLALITFGAAFRGFNPEPALSPLLYVLSFVMAFFGNCCLGLFFYVFPTGQLAPRWIRWLALSWIVYWGINNLILATIITIPGLDFVIFVGPTNERGRHTGLSLSASFHAPRAPTNEMGRLRHLPGAPGCPRHIHCGKDCLGGYHSRPDSRQPSLCLPVAHPALHRHCHPALSLVGY